MQSRVLQNHAVLLWVIGRVGLIGVSMLISMCHLFESPAILSFSIHYTQHA